MDNHKRRISTILNHLKPSESHVILNNIFTNPCAGNGKRLLDGDVAIITGSGQGIGAETAKLFAREGAKVVVSDIDAKKADKIVEEIKSEGGHAISVNGDVTDPKFPELLIQKTIEAFERLTILVLNAGYTWDGMAQNITDEQFTKMLEVHNVAPFRIVRAASPYMREAAKKEIEVNGKAAPRSIIFVSSTSGLHGNIGQANYACAKMGVVGLNKTIAKEWGQFNIRSNAVAFGLIETRLTSAKNAENKIEVNGKEVKLGIPEPLIKARQQSLKFSVPLGRAGLPTEAAGSILLLCSPYASYITGHTLEVTGGAGI